MVWERVNRFSIRAMQVSVFLVIVPMSAIGLATLIADFVTAPEWNRISVWPARAWGFFWSLVCLPAAIVLWREIPRRSLALRSRLFCVVFPVFVGLFAYISVKDGWPLGFAVLFGGQTELTVTVAQNWGSTRYCQNQVVLFGAGPFFDSVCGLSLERQADLFPSARVTLFGHGTRYGLFVSRVELSR